MPNANDLVNAMKRAALDAVESSNPVAIYFGEVKTVSPLTINVEQKMTLGEKQLILSRNVTDFKTKVTVDWETESPLSTHSHNVNITSESGGDPEHTHNITGKKKITVHNALVVGDKVILVRQQEGQKFVVWDRVGD